MANILENVGERTIEHLDYVGSLNIQWRATVRAMAQALPFVGNRYRWKAAVRQMLEIGVDAIPMVSLMAVCTGFIFAMQGASELRRFGALRDCGKWTIRLRLRGRDWDYESNRGTRLPPRHGS
jgi:ABC-type transporter Mla maintaining outer membrane lipid asymmetry permease subunit MlaE